MDQFIRDIATVINRPDQIITLAVVRDGEEYLALTTVASRVHDYKSVEPGFLFQFEQPVGRGADQAYRLLIKRVQDRAREYGLTNVRHLPPASD